MRASLIALVFLGTMRRVSAGAQEPSAERVVIMEAVVLSRAELLNDTTPLARCSLERALGSASSQIPTSRLAEAVVSPSTPCDQGGTDPKPGWRTRMVMVDSVNVQDSVATVYLTVQRGELMYDERHEVRRVANTSRWFALAIQVSRPRRIYWRRP